MNARRWLGWLGMIAWVASWFLPTLIDHSSLGPTTHPGWHAFWDAILITAAEGDMLVAPADPYMP